MNKKTFFFYDLETSGLRPRADRIMQFAGQRTSMNLEPIGEPVNILVKMTNDALPSPGAIAVTKITPQATLADGMSEAEFCQYVTDEVFVPGTIAIGYNTVRFDDEFMRATLWRNFYDPYEWEWRDGRGRWDMLDVVRLTRALRPEGIKWPFTEDGKPTNRLELITKLNGVEHEHAHDALSDVYATIAVAQLIREKQLKLFEYLLSMRDKREVQKFANLEHPQPFVYTSGRYASERNKTTVVVPLAPSRNGNILVYDLRVNYQDFDPEKCFPTVKELCYNRCPVIAPLGVLEQGDGWKKIDLTLEQVQKNWKELMEHPELAEQMRTKYEERLEFEPAEEPEGAIYEGFIGDTDKIKAAAVRNADVSRLADFHPDFNDERLAGLLLHYKGRNFPEALSESEAEEYEKYRTTRLQKQLPGFMAELEKMEDEFLKEELLLYMQSLV
ncbi:exodeoxyribonuclease I [Candidatus Saccharibacteria bacterium]|nr:exodeoxyribonuclease I [Candidatus Saccharibacteria bacterium]